MVASPSVTASFADGIIQWFQSNKVTLHIQRYPGVNLALDFDGKALCIHDRQNPEQTIPVTIFVAAVAYSNYFYIEGMTRCDISNWIRVNNNALVYFGGITQTVTPDNCKVTVTENKDWINPGRQQEFSGLGRAQRYRLIVYNENGEFIRTHGRSYTPKSWVVIPSDMPKE